MRATISNFIFAAFMTFIFSLSLAPTANAEDHEIKYRKGVMKAVGGAMGSLAAVLKSRLPGNMPTHWP